MSRSSLSLQEHDGSTTALSVLAPHHDPLRVPEELTTPVLERVVLPARRLGEELQPIGVTGVPSAPFHYPTSHGTWFWASSYLDDPTARSFGGIPIPREEYKRLKALRDAGLSFDEVWIAHEIPAPWRPGQSLPDLVPPPARLRELDERLTGVVDAVSRVVADAAAAMAQGVTSPIVPRSPSSSSAWNDAWGEGDGIDPVVLGGLSTRDAVVWFLVARWEWR
jgi:hypothetical protein